MRRLVVVGIIVLCLAALGSRRITYPLGGGYPGGGQSGTGAPGVVMEATLDYDGEDVQAQLTSDFGFLHGWRIDLQYVESGGGGTDQARTIAYDDSTSMALKYNIAIDTGWPGYAGDTVYMWARAFNASGTHVTFKDTFVLNMAGSIPDITPPEISEVVATVDSSLGYVRYAVGVTVDESPATIEVQYKLNYDGTWSTPVGASFFDYAIAITRVTSIWMDDMNRPGPDSLWVGIVVGDLPEGNESELHRYSFAIEREDEIIIPDEPEVVIGGQGYDQLGDSGDLRLTLTATPTFDAFLQVGYSRNGGTVVLTPAIETTVAADSTFSYTLALDHAAVTDDEYDVYLWGEDTDGEIIGPDEARITISLE